MKRFICLGSVFAVFLLCLACGQSLDSSTKPSDNNNGGNTPNPPGDSGNGGGGNTQPPSDLANNPGNCVLHSGYNGATLPAGFPTTNFGNAVGSTLRDFTQCLSNSNDTEYHPYAYLGQVVLISLGAGWCPPCQDEAPDIQNLYEDYKDQGFIVLMGLGEAFGQGYAADDSFLNQWSNNFGLTFPVLGDSSWSMAQYYKSSGDSGYIPLNLIVDRDGVVLYNQVGGIHVPTARNKIGQALEKPAVLSYTY